MTADLDHHAASRRHASRPRLHAYALVALLAGCTALQPPPVESPNLHVLQPALSVPAAALRRDLVLEVAAPRAAPGYDTPQIAYVRKPYELDYFANNRWADTPARMLAPLLAAALESTGAFRAIVQPASGVPADLRLGVEVMRLQQDFQSRPSRVEIELRVQLVDLRARQVIATRSFAETEPAASEDPYGGVAAANAAAARILGRIAAFCVVEAAARRPPGP